MKNKVQEARVHCLEAALGEKYQAVLRTALDDSKGEVNAALDSVKKELPKAMAAKVEFASELAEWSGNRVAVVEKLTANKKLLSIADVARTISPAELEAMVDPDAESDAENNDEAAKNEIRATVAKELATRLFRAHPAAMVARMVRAGELPLKGDASKEEVAALLDSSTPSTAKPLLALRNVDANSQPSVDKETSSPPASPAAIAEVGRLIRLASVTPTPEALPKLAATHLNSAFDIAEMPRSAFVTTMSADLGSPELAGEIHTAAVINRMRNEQALIAMREAVRGSGLAIVDGVATPEERFARLGSVRSALGEAAERLNLETLFGSLDFCECDECLSVYSPAAYFVELLQYLRNNNLDPEVKAPSFGIAGTPVEMLFRRRPDLGCLELTCDNTFKVLPYVDLANEVMESFVVYQSRYRDSDAGKKQVTLNAFNVDGETTPELLSEPQHTNYEAYCVLKNAVYPFTLPYHQPLDAIRTYLEYLKTSRFELVNTFRAATPEGTVSFTSGEARNEFQSIHEQILQRAADAEFLKMSQEEYIILTREAFWPKPYFELTQHQQLSVDEYRNKIGVRQIHEYYGYATDEDMVNADEDNPLGLTFVKKQFLKRTGIEYADLVELLKTRFINPVMPEGRPRAILDSIRYSYHYLQNSINSEAKLCERLQPIVDALLSQTVNVRAPYVLEQYCGDCQQPTANEPSFNPQELTRWVQCYFERLGKLIVLDSGDKPRLPVFGSFDVVTNTEDNSSEFPTVREVSQVFQLMNDGRVIDRATGNIAYYVSPQVNVGGYLYLIKADETSSYPDPSTINSPILDENGKDTIYAISGGKLVRSNNDSANHMLQPPAGTGFAGYFPTPQPVLWLPPQDSCNLEPVRLIHLDGTPVEAGEYDRMQRFLRLWRKLGWSIDEVDKALTGLGMNAALSDVDVTSQTDTAQSPAHNNFVDFDVFQQECHTDGSGCNNTCGHDADATPEPWVCPDFTDQLADISPAFIHQLPAVIQVMERTSLPLATVLAFWGNISTAGEKSLYNQLFLSHNIRAIDPVFVADDDGNYLTKEQTISDHLPVLMAALKLKRDDINALGDLPQRHYPKTGRIRMSHFGKAAFLSSLASTASIAFLLRVTPFS
ncbi:Tc toxin subunit A [Thiothrix nivea]|uniref:Insecticidal toxin complex/plasmid viulence protein n=1 Tax=Thiothrix nivea (strain ATCC 35100 / DSM 5205 / JP2) TaxID=870187 RepID=A0A656HB14_THINJ|nr:Tc toxin subunit A [Thiothrix nivea]EIJ33094.1 Insecticidal toxin complex/plasmid viulence protein [Thiothrix nivea DSM 5205]